MSAVENRSLPSDEQFRKRCLDAGIRDDKPLFSVLTEVRDIVEIASDAVRGGARGLSAEGEAELIKRIARTVKDASDRHRLRLERKASWLAGGVVVAALVIGGGGGFWWGWASGRQSVQVIEQQVSAAFRDGPEVAETWVSLMRNNDLRRSMAECKGAAVWSVNGHRACRIPLWMESPPSPEARAGE